MLFLLLYQLPIEVVPFISEPENVSYLYGSRQQLLADAITIQCFTAQPFYQIYDWDVTYLRNVFSPLCLLMHPWNIEISLSKWSSGTIPKAEITSMKDLIPRIANNLLLLLMSGSCNVGVSLQLQGLAKRWYPGWVNAAGKVGHKW